MASPLQVACVVEPNFGENAYVVWCRDGGPCWIMDPGLPPSAKQISKHVAQHKLKPEGVLLTHGHLDHIAGVPELLGEFAGLPVLIAKEEKQALVDPEENLSGDFGAPVVVGEIETRDLAAGSDLTLDDSNWRVLDTSGHSPGGRSLYCAAAGIVFVGDALFQGSIGRTDFHHSDPDGLIRNIREKLFSLPDETEVYSGHGPVTTIGEEKRYNPFLR
ncbi:MAG TPA: MBL fold metallo-hydrolase [Phycisphaerae bacterium]|nr:MBL fold metallo-hydrolase [Phycisphaerae bacterium]